MDKGWDVKVNYRDCYNRFMWPKDSGIMECKRLIVPGKADEDLLCTYDNCPFRVEDSNPIASARATIREAFAADPEWRDTYVANISMLLHDAEGMAATRSTVLADKILKLIFD